MTEALAIHDLRFRYGARDCVRGVSLSIRPGDCYGFLGHNGAGKTTVMRLVLGLLRPAGGTVSVFGHDASNERRRVNALIGAVIERPGFRPQLTASDNLVALARLQGIERRAARVESGRVLQAVGLDGAAKRRVTTFSMGMRQRLGIAQALLGGPRLLLLDEPTTALDPEGIADLRALLLRLTRDHGVAVMLSSHQLAELEGLCNRVGVLRDGAMVVEGELQALRRRLATRHVVTGTPLDRLADRLRELELTPTIEADRLLVELDGQRPGTVVRELAQAGELASFGPEQATLERIYLQAGLADLGPGRIDADPEPEPATEPQPPAAPALGTALRPWRRVARFEARALLRPRALAALVLVPAAIAVWSVLGYARGVDEALALVRAEERFSADAGSGFFAFAQALQQATPCLGLVLLWFASQSIAGELGNDTLRNTLIRSVRRIDVLLGKLGVQLTAMLVGWTALLIAATTASALTVGFGDLEEVTRYGDRDLLVGADEVWPTAVLAALQLPLPLAAFVVLGVAASVVARRAALALALAMLLVLVPELLRGVVGEQAGWLLTSHVPVFSRDDSALGYLAATARGAADALWPHAEHAVSVPLVWLASGLGVVGLVFVRLRIR